MHSWTKLVCSDVVRFHQWRLAGSVCLINKLFSVSDAWMGPLSESKPSHAVNLQDTLHLCFVQAAVCVCTCALDKVGGTRIFVLICAIFTHPYFYRSLVSSYLPWKAAFAMAERERVGKARERDHLPRLSGALPRPQDPPLPSLLLQGVRSTTGPPSRAQQSICVP